MRRVAPWAAWSTLLLWAARLALAARASQDEESRQVTPITGGCAVSNADLALADWVSALQTGLQLHGLSANATSGKQPRRVELYQTSFQSMTSASLKRQSEPASVVLILLVVIGAPLGMAMIFLCFLTEEPKKRVIYRPPPTPSPSVSTAGTGSSLVVRLPPQPVFHDREDAGAGAGGSLLRSYSGALYNAGAGSMGALGNAGAGAMGAMGSAGAGAAGAMGALGDSMYSGFNQTGAMFSQGIAGIGSNMTYLGSGIGSSVKSLSGPWATSELQGPAQPEPPKRIMGSDMFDINASREEGVLEPMAVVREREGLHVRMMGSPEAWQQETLLDIVNDNGQVILRVLISESSRDSEILLQSVQRLPVAYMKTNDCVAKKGAPKIPQHKRVAYLYDLPPDFGGGGEQHDVFATARPMGGDVTVIRRGDALEGPAWYQVRTAAGSRSNIVNEKGALIATTRAQRDSSGHEEHFFALSAGADAAMVIMAFVAARKCS